jgi:hypothetical protein
MYCVLIKMSLSLSACTNIAFSVKILCFSLFKTHKGRFCVTFLLWTFYLIILTHTSLLQYVKPEAAVTVFELLVMGSVSPETC